MNVDVSGWNTKGRNIILNLVKTNPGEYWPRLTKDKVKNAHIQADWAKWVDEDEEDEAKPLPEDWNQDNMNQFGGEGMGGMGMGGDDSDDEEEEEEHDHAGHAHGEHVHSENCSHGAGNADLGDLDAEEDMGQAEVVHEEHKAE